MLETQNKIKSDKTLLIKLKAENSDAKKILHQHEKLLYDSEEIAKKTADRQQMNDSLAEIEKKLKKVRKRTKIDERSYAEQHEATVGVEERCR